MEIFEIICVIIFSILVIIVVSRWFANWYYKWQQKQKTHISLRFQEKFAYLNGLIDKPIDDKNYKEIIQDYCDLKPKSTLEHVMKDDLCARFKFKYASYLVNEETEGI
jgi:hypothetical protein